MRMLCVVDIVPVVVWSISVSLIHTVDFAFPWYAFAARIDNADMLSFTFDIAIVELAIIPVHIDILAYLDGIEVAAALIFVLELCRAGIIQIFLAVSDIEDI